MSPFATTAAAVISVFGTVGTLERASESFICKYLMTN